MKSVRLEALNALRILDTTEDQAYDDLTRMAAGVLQAPVALISLVDADRQWFKSRVGLQISQSPRENSFCDYAIRQPQDMLLVHDAMADPRFASNPLVTGEPHIRFYAGVPLVLRDGSAVGTLCVIDTKPRDATDQQLEELQFLAAQVVGLLEGRGDPFD